MASNCARVYRDPIISLPSYITGGTVVGGTVVGGTVVGGTVVGGTVVGGTVVGGLPVVGTVTILVDKEGAEEEFSDGLCALCVHPLKIRTSRKIMKILTLSPAFAT